MNHSYTIIGTGALGGYYGARLAHAGAEVSFLLHSDYEHVRRHGLKVESPEGDFSIARPRICRDANELPAADVVLVCLKTTQNHLLAQLLPPATTAPGACVLMMQNGLHIEADAAAVVPGHPVLGGLAFLCSNKVGPGHIRHLDYGAIRLGEYSGGNAAAGITARMRRIAEDFEAAGVSVDLEEDLARARWKKLVWNVPYNGLCVVQRCTTDVLMADPTHRALCEEIMREVLAIAEASGAAVPGSFAAQMLAHTEAMAAYSPSMKLDFESDRPLELEAIYARPLEAARRTGVDCPRIRELYEALLLLDPAAAASSESAK